MHAVGDAAGQAEDRPSVSPLKRRLNRLMQRESVRHLVRAVDRFNDRLGTQFAGAITYFSFLAVVPIMMVAFSIAGFVLSSKPSLLTDLRNDIAKLLPSGLTGTIGEVLDAAVAARFTVGIIGLLIALYSGVSWVGNVRTAIQAQWRPDFDDNQETRKESLPKYYGKSLIYLVTLGAAILASFLLTAAASWAQAFLLRLLGWDDAPPWRTITAVTPVLVALVADVAIFYLLYDRLSPRDVPAQPKALFRGAVMAAIAFEVLKLGLTLLLPLLLTSATAKLFGPVIGLLFFFNLVATVVLFLAAWIATARTAATPTGPTPANKLDHVEAIPGKPNQADA